MNVFDVLGTLFAEHNLNKDEIIVFVPHALDGFRFIYADPDAPPVSLLLFPHVLTHVLV